MTEDPIAALLDQLTVLIKNQNVATNSPGHSGCADCCDCTTVRSFEASAVRHNEAQAFIAAESSKAFVQQQGLQFATLLDQQQRHLKPQAPIIVQQPTE